MKVEQISVFLENRAGRLAEVIHLLACASINLHGLSLADTSDFGILRLIVCEREKAKTLLMDNGFTVGVTTVVAVELAHKPGGLDSVLQLVGESGINVEYMYAIPRGDKSKIIMIFRFDMADRAISLFNENGILMLDEAALCAIS